MLFKDRPLLWSESSGIEHPQQVATRRTHLFKGIPSRDGRSLVPQRQSPTDDSNHRRQHAENQHRQQDTPSECESSHRTNLGGIPGPGGSGLSSTALDCPRLPSTPSAARLPPFASLRMPHMSDLPTRRCRCDSRKQQLFSSAFIRCRRAAAGQRGGTAAPVREWKCRSGCPPRGTSPALVAPIPATQEC
jgi:hypothetical protein